MYISKLILNLKSKDVRRDISDCYEMHRTLCRVYPDKEEGGTGRILFRMENLSNKYGCQDVIVVSEKKPEWKRLSSGAYLIESFVKEYDPHISDRQVLRFLLKANPTVKRDGKRKGLYGIKEQEEWFLRKSENCGFKPVDFSCRQDEYIKNDSGKKMEFLSVLYEGILQITDSEKFKRALYYGIGCAKGMGFGLLTIAKD
jgi:CRISPR system Cascade subunit CasE